jgi:ribosome maturation factor RimP
LPGSGAFDISPGVFCPGYQAPGFFRQRPEKVGRASAFFFAVFQSKGPRQPVIATANMYRDIPEKLLRVVEPVVRSHGLELVDAALGHGPTRALIRVVLDTPQGDGRVRVDECAAVSREIGHGLDVSEFLGGAYTLQVSSPGVDRHLGREIDFERVVGREVALETREPRDGRRRFKGELVAFDGVTATLRVEGRELCIPFADVERAQAFYPFPQPHKSSSVHSAKAKR